MKTEIDHVAHGWALLALRVPEIRALAEHRQSIEEMCEAYSIAVLHLRELRNLGPDTEQITEYESLVAGIEYETSYYLTMRAQLSPNFAGTDPAQPRSSPPR
ncbi:hypothetical protein [Rhizobium sp. AN80A]|uniref:hypothetical protein n=1 Tax=Rhizobium sp. AN80A TaxID=3040673 RepID=UPI000DBFA8A5|nr:hypothetical protein [Rhizobium sp. AN80A]